MFFILTSMFFTTMLLITTFWLLYFPRYQGSQIYIRELCAPRRPFSGKILTCATLAYLQYIIVNFQLRSSINAGLTERSLYNTFCIEKSLKMGLLGDFEGLRYQVGTPGNALTAERRLVKKCGNVLYTLVYRRSKVITKKRNVYVVRVTFHPCAVLTPLNHLLPLGACGVLWAT